MFDIEDEGEESDHQGHDKSAGLGRAQVIHILQAGLVVLRWGREGDGT
jgi:hypothetical protein